MKEKKCSLEWQLYDCRNTILRSKNLFLSFIFSLCLLFLIKKISLLVWFFEFFWSCFNHVDRIFLGSTSPFDLCLLDVSIEMEGFFLVLFHCLYYLEFTMGCAHAHTHRRAMYIVVNRCCWRIVSIYTKVNITFNQITMKSSINNWFEKQKFERSNIRDVRTYIVHTYIHLLSVLQSYFPFNSDIWRWNQMTRKQILIWVVCFVPNLHKTRTKAMDYIYSFFKSRCCIYTRMHHIHLCLLKKFIKFFLFKSIS